MILMFAEKVGKLVEELIEKRVADSVVDINCNEFVSHYSFNCCGMKSNCIYLFVSHVETSHLR